MSFEEKEALKAIAKTEGLSLSEFLRDVALGVRVEKPAIPFEIRHDRENKAKVRDSWIGSTARILMMEKGLSKVAATMQATKEWEAAND